MNQKNTMRLFLLLALAAQAATASVTGGGLPWDTTLGTLASSLTGPVATAVAGIAFTICGCMLAFGHDWGDFARRAALVTLAVSFVQLSTRFMSALGITGATI